MSIADLGFSQGPSVLNDRPPPTLIDTGTNTECAVCHGARVLVHTGDGLAPDPDWHGGVLPNLRGGTIVKPGQAVECHGCVDAKTDPAQSELVTVQEVEAFR